MSKTDTREIRIRGGQHHQMHEAIERGWLQPRTELFLEREPENTFDSRAVKVYVQASRPCGVGDLKETLGRVCIGYVSAKEVGQLYWRLDRGAVVMRCTVLNIIKNAVTAHLELSGGWKAIDTPPKKETTENEFDLEDDIPF